LFIVARIRSCLIAPVVGASIVTFFTWGASERRHKETKEEEEGPGHQ
jgi:hypothetical protein